MKPANRAPAYATIYHGLAEVARRYGYALALHGSMLTDLDIVAVPWVQDAASAEDVKNAIRAHIGACLTNVMADGKEYDIPEAKPHGRKAWKFQITDGCGSVDLSVMPRLEGDVQ